MPISRDRENEEQNVTDDLQTLASQSGRECPRRIDHRDSVSQMGALAKAIATYSLAILYGELRP